MADLEIRLTDGNKMAMKHESTTRDLSRPFVFHIVAFGPHASEAPGIQVHWLLPPVSSLTHLPSFNFIPTALHWALSGPVFCPVFPVLMSYAQVSTCMHIAFARGSIGCVCMQTLTACNVHGKQRPAFTFLPSCPRQISSVADWMHSIPEPGNLFRTDVMARDNIHVMTKNLERNSKISVRNWNQALLRRPNPAILTAGVGRWNSAARIEQQIPNRCFDRNTLNPDSAVGPFHRILTADLLILRFIVGAWTPPDRRSLSDGRRD
ncbi:hypothetical protein DFH08DRAFT_825308 [Mycena albidolilacea]|uniref:Uncharacterized protein n=1 Tax=Mycena albidolilacea TaxID=1033008 RepID=A0AAD7EAA3_9AGAR|nr:hypothetical protein DFH08DRAFT_825308 [Mycena albidolilacea]